ncbi:lactonase family protein [Bacillaceae bacterium S4-13-58]
MTEFTGYIGTYTKEKSKGVYKFTLDTEKQRITEVTLAAELDNPTYLTLGNHGDFLYSVAKEGDSGGIVAFSIGEKGNLIKLNDQMMPGSPPCHLSISNDSHNILTANYHTTVIASYLTNEDGSLQTPEEIIKHEGSGPHERQEKPHLHFAGFSPDEKYAVVVDLGSDRITTYEVNGGKLQRKNVFQTSPGSGPRHIVFHPNGNFAYVMTELSSEVLVFEYNQMDGRFNEIQAIPTIPNNFNEVNDGSAIQISSDGNFIYAGNRGHNSIAVFKVDEESGFLNFVEWTSTEGDWPRDFSLDPSEEFLVASNQKSNSLTLFQRDKTKGSLTLLQSDVYVPEPVCVKFR